MHRGKLFPLFLLLMGLLVVLSSCASDAPKATQAPTEAPTIEPTVLPEVQETEAAEDADGVIRLTMHFVDPSSSPYAKGGEKIAELVEKATDGKIVIEVLAGGVLGGERETIEMAMDGKLDIATAANSVMTNYIPQMNILDQAYLWKNSTEAHAAVDGPVGELIRERALTLGLHVIGFEESGFRNTFSTKPIDTMEDFAGVTIRTMENKYHQAAFSAFGANPVPMAYTEVFDALKDGTIDACENATANCLNSGYYEVTKHVTNTSHAFVYIVLCMSDNAWNRIPEDLRDPFMNAVKEGVAWEREALETANEEATETLKNLGVTFHDIDVAQLQAAYQAKAKEMGFTFDSTWQAAVDRTLEDLKDAE